MSAVLGKGKDRQAMGESKLHATLIKVAVKKVFTQTGLDGRSRKVAHTQHVTEGLGQLVNAARVGRFFYGGWAQALLYTCTRGNGAGELEASGPTRDIAEGILGL